MTQSNSDNDFENIVDIAPFPILIHRIGEIKYVNAYCLELFEVTETSFLVGKNILDFIYPDDKPAVIEAIRRGLVEKVRHSILNARIITGKGNIVNTQTKSSSLMFRGEECRLVVAYEYDHAVKVEEKLRDKELLLQKISDILPDCMIVVDNKTRKVIFENRSLPETLGYTREDLAPFQDQFDFIQHIIHPDDLNKLISARKELFDAKNEGKYIVTEYRIKDKSGKWHWLLSRSTLFRKFEEEGHQLSFGIVQDITLLKNYEQQLTEQKQLLQKITSTVPNHISVFDLTNNQVVYQNFPFTDALGYPSGYQMNTPFDVVHPDHLPVAMERLNKILHLKEGEIFSAVGEFKNYNGSKRKMFTRITPFLMNDDGTVRQVLVSLTDLQELEEAQLRLEASEEKRKAILYALPDLVFQLSADGVVTDFYPNVELQGILESMQFVGKSVYDVLHNRDANEVLNLIQKVLTDGEMRTYEYTHTTSKQTLHFEFRFVRIRHDSVIVVVRDVTNLRKTQHELQQKLNELSEKNLELERYITSNTELEKFAYIASHDLREPIRSVVGFAQLIQKRNARNLDNESKEFLENIIQSAQRMNQLVHGLLEYSRVNNTERRFRPVKLNDTLNTVVSDLRASMDENKAVVNFGELPEVIGDEIQLRQLFQNLISNAIKFRKEDEDPVVKIAAVKNNSGWLFSVTDNGLGIDMKHSKSIFQLFNRLHNTNKYPGTGIGLAVCKKIVERHGGEIWIESEPAKGTTFYFTLPG